MSFTRRSRCLAAVLAIVGLLLAQLAVAAHACPGEDAMAMARMMDADAPCCGAAVDDPEPALCKAHCEQGERSLDKPATPSMALMAVAPSVVVAYAAGPPITATPGEQRSLLARPTAPPLAVRHCCLRI